MQVQNNVKATAVNTKVDEQSHGGSKQERRRHMRKGLWSIVVGGVVGALLWAGPVGARPFPGGLAACQASLGTCQTDLRICQTALAECQVFPGDGVEGPALSYHDNG